MFDPKAHTAPIIIMAYDSNNAALRCVFFAHQTSPDTTLEVVTHRAHDLLLCRFAETCGTAATRCTTLWRRARPTTRASCS